MPQDSQDALPALTASIPELGGGYEQYDLQLTVNGTDTVLFVNASTGR